MRVKTVVWEKRVLGLDCGTKSFGWCALRIRLMADGAYQFRVLGGGLLESPVNNLTHIAKVEKVTVSRKTGKAKKTNAGKSEPPLEVGVRLFTDELDYLFSLYKITHMSAERFMSRGRGGDSTIEAISLMLGLVIAECAKRDVPYTILAAATWKLACARAVGDKEILAELYHYAKSEYGKEPHAFDAALMAAYTVVDTSSLAKVLRFGFIDHVVENQSADFGETFNHAERELLAA